MNQPELIDRYLDALNRDPQAAPPAGLDAATATFVRALWQAERVESSSQNQRESLWFTALKQAQRELASSDTITSQQNGVEQHITIRRPSSDGDTFDYAEEDETMYSATQDLEHFQLRPRATTSGMRWLTLIAAALVVVIMGLLTIIVFRAGFVSNPLMLGPGEPTPTPSPTPIPTPQVITKDNANQLELLQVFGYGLVFDVNWSGDVITVLTSNRYVAEFDANALDKLPHYVQLPSQPVSVNMPYLDTTVSADGKMLAISQSQIHLYDRESGSEQTVIQVSGISLLTFSADGTIVAGGSRAGKKIYLWNTLTGTELVQLKDGDIFPTTLAFSPDGTLLAAGYSDNHVRLWEVKTGQLLAVLKGHRDSVTSVTFSPDGKLLASSSDDGSLLIWDWKALTGAQRVTLQRQGEAINQVAFSPDGSLLATASSDHTVQLWDIATGAEKSRLTGHTDNVREIAFSPDGSRLVSFSLDETLRLWDVASGNQVGQATIAQGHTGRIFAAWTSRDGKILVSAGGEGLVRIWDVATGAVKHTLQAHSGGVYSVAFSPDDKTILSNGEDGIIRLWDVETGTLLSELRGHKNRISVAVFSPDGSKIASASDDLTIRLWDVATGESQRIEGHSPWGVVFSADGKLIIFPGTDRRLRVWDTTTNSEYSTSRTSPESVGGVDRSPVETLVTFGGTEHQIWLWNYITGESQELVGHTAPVNGPFSPDGKLILSCANDNTCRLWDVATVTQINLLKTDGSEVFTWFSQDGSKIILERQNGSLELWGVPLSE